MTDNDTSPGLRAEVADLRARLAEAKEILRAIRGGEADALVIAGDQGDRVHLLGKGDRVYRQFVEAVHEGTATVSDGGEIRSCSTSLAQALCRPLDQILGTPMRDHLSPDDHDVFSSCLAQACQVSYRKRIHLKSADGSLLPVYLSTTRLLSAGEDPVCCLVFTDLEEVVSAEQELRESEAKLRQTQIAAGLGSYVLDIPAGRWRSSDELDKLLGIEETYERTTQGWLALVHPDDRAGIVDFLRNGVPGQGQSFDRDFRIIRHDDHGERWMHGLGRLTRDAHGHPLAMYGTIQDVTGRKEAEARILRLVQLYAALSKCSEASVRSASEEELFTTVCRDAVQFGGMKMAWIGLVDETGQRVLPVASYGEGVEYLNGIRITTDAGDPFGRGPTGTAIRENLPFWCQDFLQDPTTTPWHEAGVRFGWAVSAALPLTRSGGTVGSLTLYAGKVEGFDTETRQLLTEMACNISFALDKFAAEAERQSAVQALRESEERYRALFENSPDAVLLTAPDGSILSANPAACRMFGRTMEELCALGRSGILDTGDPRLARLLEERARTGRASGELTFLRRDGSTFPGEVSSLLFRDRLGATRTSMIIRDITEHRRDAEEKRKLEEQLRQAQKVEAIGRLTGGIAHDFNNLTAIVLGYGEMLLGHLRPDEPAHKWVEQILAAGKRSATLTGQLLAFSRKQVLLPVVLDLNGLLRNLEKMLARLIGEDIALTFDLAEDLGRVTVDPGQLEQVVTNLVVNARDAMPRGGKLTVRTANADLDEVFVRDHPSVVPGGYVMLTVADTGCGMDKATLARLFEPFFTTKEQGKGTGLGLSTAFGVVKQSGGYLYVASELEKGATFTIYLPRTQAQPKAAAIEASGETPHGGGERVLLVEDEESLRELCKVVLSRLGYHVSTAGNGPEALLLAGEKGFEPDIVVTDVVMPGMSGVEMVQRLRSERPDLKVLYMSGYPDDTIAPHGVLAPGMFFLPKPFSESTLAAKVRETLAGSKPAGRVRSVLMIDDDEQFIDLMRHFCRKRGHDFAGADSAAAALQALAGRSFDVLLVDLNIPGTSGEDVLRKIRAAGHTAPAIVLTADVASADLDLLRPLGVVRALQKSSDAEPLLRAIAEATTDAL